MFGIPNLRSCCGCCSVEFGAKIIAWIQLIVGVLIFIYNIESLVALYLTKHIDRAFIYILIALKIAFGFYPILQGTLLLLGIKKKRANFLLVWLILTIICEMFVTTAYALFLICVTIFYGEVYAPIIIYYSSGIQIGISFFFIVIVSTCRKNILRRNALFDYGVIYTPDAVEILTPNRRTGLIATNSQFDYVSLDIPKDETQNVTVK